MPEDSIAAPAPRRRVLVLAPRDPYPVIGGDRIRIHRLIRELAPYHDFTLVTFCRSRRERDAPPPADGLFKAVHRIVLPYWRSVTNTLGALATGEPLQVAFYRSAEFRATVEALAPSHDAVLAHLVRTAEYARDLPLLRILEMTDAISMNLARVASLDAGYFDARRWIYALEAPRMRAYERRVVKDFDVVSLTSQVDKSFLLAGADEFVDRMLVVPNGVDTPDDVPPPQAARNPDEIAFVGHMSTLQNYDAAWFFAHDVLPRIRARRPNAVFPDHRADPPDGCAASRRVARRTRGRARAERPRRARERTRRRLPHAGGLGNPEQGARLSCGPSRRGLLAVRRGRHRRRSARQTHVDRDGCGRVGRPGVEGARRRAARAAARRCRPRLRGCPVPLGTTRAAACEQARALARAAQRLSHARRRRRSGYARARR